MLNNIVNNGPQPTGPSTSATGSTTTTPAKEQASVIEEKPAAPEPKELQSAVKKLNDFVQNIQRTLSFSINEDTGTTVVQVFDSETDQLIRQIPGDETIKLAASIEAQAASLLLKEQA